MSINALNGTDTQCFTPQGVTAAATAVVMIDTLGADWASIRVGLSDIVTSGVASADGATVSLKEAAINDTNSSNATTFVADRTGIKLKREVRYEVDTRTRKRYLRLSVTPGTSGVTNEPITCCAFATLSRRELNPASTSDMVAGSNDAVVVT